MNAKTMDGDSPVEPSERPGRTERAQFCSEDEISRLVHTFYGRVRADALLGPVFDAHITDWDHHLGKMVNFWSSTLRGTARYRGTPMPAHVALPGLDENMFRHWLALFADTVAELGNPRLAERATVMAERIAQSLWFGYQMHRRPGVIPRDMELGEPGHPPAGGIHG